MSTTPTNSQETVHPVRENTDLNDNVAATQVSQSTQLSDYSEPSQTQKEVLAEKLSQVKSQPGSPSQTTTDPGTPLSSQASNPTQKESQRSDTSYKPSKESQDQQSSESEEV